MYHPYQLKEGEVLPGPNLAITELPLAAYDQLDWDNYIPQLLQENIRAGVEHVVLKYKAKSIKNKIRSPEASQDLWTACMGQGEQELNQDPHYWSSFKPREMIFTQLKDIMMPVADPDFSAYHFKMRTVSLRDQLHYDIISPAEYQYELAKLNEKLVQREDAEQIIQQLEREHEVQLQRNSRDSTRVDDDQGNETQPNETVISLYGGYIQSMDGLPVSGIRTVGGKPVAVQKEPTAAASIIPGGAEANLPSGGARMKPTNPWNIMPGRPKVASTPLKEKKDKKDKKDPLN